MRRDWICRIGALLSVAVFVAVWLADPVFSADPVEQTLWKSVIFRLCGSVVFLFVLLYLGYRVCRIPSRGWLFAFLPALAVSVNNAPILGLITGQARVDRTDLLLLFVLDSLLIGIFEELAFRGVLFPSLLEKRRNTKMGIFWTAVISSALFGLIHLANLLEGADVGGTLLQVGYSFLIGGMCAIVLLKTGNLLLCILLHGIYDFGGHLISTLGSGSLWDTPTVILTAVLGVAVTAWMLTLLLRIDPLQADRLYPVRTDATQIEKKEKGDLSE